MTPLMKDLFSRSVDDRGIHFDLIAVDKKPAAASDKTAGATATEEPDQNAYGKKKTRRRKRG